jgi:formimidoylglutamate deiminase
LTDRDRPKLIAWLPEFVYAEGQFQSRLAVVSNSEGLIDKIVGADQLTDEKKINLPRRALLPGMVNAHSHAFQRVLRGRTEYRTSDQRDSFWTWREMMYSAATRLSPEDVYDASRMAFLEMALSGITSVGEFHYLHHAPDGKPYDDPNLLAKEVIRAANELGLRIALLRVAYARSGFQMEANPRQVRFIEDSKTYLKNLESLIWNLGKGAERERSTDFNSERALPDRPTPAGMPGRGPRGRASDTAWVGVAPHSVRAVPLEYLQAVIGYANEHGLKTHMHVAEQPAEVSACVEEYRRTPTALLESEGLLGPDFTAVHAIHVTPKAIAAFAKTAAMVCACPTTERNLGDGVVPADGFQRNGTAICLGSDSHAQIDLLEDARELEYHVRLQKLERAVISPSDPTDHPASDAARYLFDCATINGARSIGTHGGILAAGKPADFFTVDLDDPSIAGASQNDLLAGIVFTLSRAAVREVVVAGKPVVSEGRHLIQEEVVERFNDLQKKLWK